MMDRYRLVCAIVLFLCFSASAMAQDETTITGQVTHGESDETLPGVNIVLKGTDSGTTTDADGQYEMTVPSLNDTLVFSFVGYQSQEVPIDNRTEIDVAMNLEVVSGEEVVVVGYGTRTKETLTGSVSAVSGENLEKTPVTNVSNSLGGKLPGVVSVTDSGEPGYDGSTIRIRGDHTLNNNNPLVVIDGVPNRAGGLDRLNPKDIENISVLKDASAAIYGAQAANGVILVTTKRGSEGAPQFNVDFNQGANQPARVPEMADAPTYLEMLNEIDRYRGNDVRYSEERIQNHREVSDPWLYPDTDWFAEALKPVSYQSKADMSVSGGSESIRYNLSLGALTEDGYYENSATRYNQYNFRSNLDGQINDNISLRFDVSGRMEDRNFPTQGAGDNFRMLIRGKPHQHAFWPNGQPGPDIENGQNPVITGSDATGYNDDERYYLQSNLQLNIQIPAIDGLSLRGGASYDKDFLQQKVWTTPWTLYSFDSDAYQQEGDDPEQYLTGAPRGPSEPQLTQVNEDNYNILLNLIAEYQQDLGDHSIGALVGTERQSFRESSFNAFRRYFISDQIDQLFAGGEDERDNSGSAREGARLNFFSRFNYDYQDKYLVEVVGRYDGSYIFPEGNRFGFFPAFSLGWRLTEEDFFTNNVGFFDDLKLRFSWGQTGNDRIDEEDQGGEWQFLSTYGFGSGYVLGGDTEVTGLYSTRTPNPNITWEVANQLDIGLDGEILDSRLSFELDYFDYLRTNILHYRNASVPQTSGLSLPRENIGEVDSWGFDGSVTWRQNVNDDFLYDVSLSAGYATNKIRFWDEPPGAEEWQRSTGHKMNTGLYYNAIGVFQDEEHIEQHVEDGGALWNDDVRPGDLIFEDVDGDGEITADDQIRINKNRTPDWTGGVTFTAAYKQFDMTAFFQGAAGGVHYVATESGDFGNYFNDYAENRWRPDPDDHMAPHPDYGEFDEPRAYNRADEYWSPMASRNTHFLRDTDYIRLKNFEIGYRLDSDISNRIGIQNARVYVNGFNLLTWDKFKLMDPEASAEGGQYYPQKRVFNAGLSVTF